MDIAVFHSGSSGAVQQTARLAHEEHELALSTKLHQRAPVRGRKQGDLLHRA